MRPGVAVYFCAEKRIQEWRWKKFVGIVVFLLFLLTSVFGFSRPRSVLFEYLGDISHPYKTPDEVVATYL